MYPSFKNPWKICNPYLKKKKAKTSCACIPSLVGGDDNEFGRRPLTAAPQ